MVKGGSPYVILQTKIRRSEISSQALIMWEKSLYTKDLQDLPARTQYTKTGNLQIANLQTETGLQKETLAKRFLR